MTPTPRQRRVTSRTRLRPGHVVVLLALVACAALLAQHAGAAAASQAPIASTSAQKPVRPMASSPGQQVFLRECAWCHGNSGDGTQFGPSLSGVGAATADFYLRTGRMPLENADQKAEPGPPAYSDATIKALVAYVAGLGPGPAIPDVKPGVIGTGRDLFLSNCAACHSSSGTGVIVSGGQRAPQLYGDAPAQVAEAVRLGPGPMPPFTDKQLSSEELDDLVSYVGQLGPKQVRGGQPLDQFGPIAEGFFAWLVLMPLVVLVARLLGKKAKR